jgi:hypothetical protein
MQAHVAEPVGVWQGQQRMPCYHHDHIVRSSHPLMMAAFAAAVCTTGCLISHYGPNALYSGTITVVAGGRATATTIVLDTPEVRQLIAAYEAKTDAMMRSLAAQRPRTWQEYRRLVTPDRTEFLAAMAAAPHVTVNENTRCRMIERSKAGCSPIAESTITYVRVLVTDGPSKAQEAWICRDPYSLPGERP